MKRYTCIWSVTRMIPSEGRMDAWTGHDEHSTLQGALANARQILEDNEDSEDYRSRVIFTIYTRGEP